MGCSLRKTTSPSPELARALRAASFAEERGESHAQIVGAFARALGRRENPCGAGAGKAAVRYRLTHWGLGGKSARPVAMRAADPTCGVYTLLGELRSVVYFTEKGGDGGPAEYEHEFSRPRPELLYSDGGLVIAGGGYHVSARGIVR